MSGIVEIKDELVVHLQLHEVGLPITTQLQIQQDLKKSHLPRFLSAKRFSSGSPSPLSPSLPETRRRAWGRNCVTGYDDGDETHKVLKVLPKELLWKFLAAFIHPT